MTPAERDRFDRLLEDAIAALPPAVRAVIEEVPVIVLDRPDAELIAELKREGTLPPDATGDPADLLGLHSGVAITERSVDAPAQLPPQIHVFREGVLAHACGEEGWNAPHADEDVYEEVRITLLHEIGHHFGLDEEDLEGLGYG